MSTTTRHVRSRPIPVGHLRAFEAVARHLNFRAAAEELFLTQSAVSRQIQALEDEVGSALFLRHTRAVELTGAGLTLLRATGAALERIDGAVRQIRQRAGRRTVTVTTWASFASMWLIPRLEAFQREHPDIDIRIDSGDAKQDLATSDVDLALRYATPPTVPANAICLFGEQLTPVASPWLLKDHPIAAAQDLRRVTLIEAGDIHPRNQQWLGWQRWLDTYDQEAGPTPFLPQRWLYFNYANQIVQAALTGQGVALARLPMVAQSLAMGDLVEPLAGMRLGSPYAYWLVPAPDRGPRSEVAAFSDWLLKEAAQTRAAIGEMD